MAFCVERSLALPVVFRTHWFSGSVLCLVCHSLHATPSAVDDTPAVFDGHVHSQLVLVSILSHDHDHVWTFHRALLHTNHCGVVSIPAADVLPVPVFVPPFVFVHVVKIQAAASQTHHA